MFSFNRPGNSSKKEYPPKEPTTHAEAFRYFKQEVQSVKTDLAGAQKAADAAINYAHKQGKKFTSPELMKALVNERNRLSSLKKRIAYMLDGTMPGTSWGTPTFRTKRETPREDGKHVSEHIGSFVFGDKTTSVLDTKERTGADPVTTRLMSLKEIDAFVVSLKQQARFNDPANPQDLHSLPKELIRVEKPTRVWRPKKKNAEAVSPPLSQNVSEQITTPPTEPVPPQQPRQARPEAPQERVSTTEGQQLSLDAAFHTLEQVIAEYKNPETYVTDEVNQEAHDKLSHAFEMYLAALYREAPEEYASQRQDVLQMYRALKDLRRSKQEQDAYVDTAAQQERAFIAEVVRQERDPKLKKKRKAAYWRTLAAALTLLGVEAAAGKYVLDQVAERPPVARSYDDFDRSSQNEESSQEAVPEEDEGKVRAFPFSEVVIENADELPEARYIPEPPSRTYQDPVSFEGEGQGGPEN